MKSIYKVLQEKKEEQEKRKDLSFKELEELMGIRRPVYKRHKGAYRQK